MEVEPEVQSPFRCFHLLSVVAAVAAVSKPCLDVPSKSDGGRVKLAPTWGGLEKGNHPKGPVQTKPVMLLKQVVLHHKKQSPAGNSAFQREGKVQRDVLKGCPPLGALCPPPGWGECGIGQVGCTSPAPSTHPFPNLAERARLQVIKFLFCCLATSLQEARSQSALLPCSLLCSFPFLFSLFLFFPLCWQEK